MASNFVSFIPTYRAICDAWKLHDMNLIHIDKTRQIGHDMQTAIDAAATPEAIKAALAQNQNEV